MLNFIVGLLGPIGYFWLLPTFTLTHTSNLGIVCIGFGWGWCGLSLWVPRGSGSFVSVVLGTKSFMSKLSSSA